MYLVEGSFALLSLIAAAPAQPALPNSSVADAVVLKALCPEDKSCRVLDKVEAGKDRHGRDLTFAGVKVLPKAELSRKRGRPGVAKGGDGDVDEGEGGDAACLPAPYGILHTAADRLVSVEPIVVMFEDGCHKGPRFEGGGETITFDGKIVTHIRDYDDTWDLRWTNTWEIQPRVRWILKESEGFSYDNPGNAIRTTTDRRTGRIKVAWGISDCDEDGKPADNADPEFRYPGRYAYTLLPRLASDDPFVKDWKTAAFPKQGLVVTSEGGDGYLVYGPPGAARDARMRVVALTPGEIVIEVADPKIASGAKSWVADDHLEVWGGDELPQGETQTCVVRDPSQKVPERAASVGTAQQWGIRTSDGSVFRGWGNPSVDPKVERVVLKGMPWGEVVRFRVGFAKAFSSLTVAYSDSDNGKRQKRLISTSRIRLKDPLSLGEIAE